MQRIAVLGLGTMGIGMARNLLESFEVAGYNRSAGRGSRLEEGGGRYFRDPVSAVAGAEAVVACLANDTANREVLLDTELLNVLPSGSLFIDCGTTGLEVTETLAERCSTRGIDFLDAPITGSKLGAEAGRLTFMVGGPAATVDRARPLFDAMGRHVVHAGPSVGDGQRIKYCLNMTQAIVMEGILEGYALARAQGLDPAALAEVFEHSAGKTGVGSFKTPYLEKRDFEPHFRLDLMRKDLHLALSAARDGEQPVPLAHAVTALYDQAVQRGLGAEDFIATVKLLEPTDR